LRFFKEYVIMSPDDEEFVQQPVVVHTTIIFKHDEVINQDERSDSIQTDPTVDQG